MCTYAEWAAGLLAKQLEAYGKPITFRKVTSSGSVNPSLNPVSGSIAVATAALAGATTIDLSAPAGSWMLLEGDTFTVAGDTTVYAVGASVHSVSGKFPAVSISPAVAQDAAPSAACTFIWSADHTVKARIKTYDARLINGTTINVRDLQVLMVAADVLGRPVPMPTTLDKIAIDGVFRSVGIVNPVYAAADPVLWDCQAKG